VLHIAQNPFERMHIVGTVDLVGDRPVIGPVLLEVPPGNAIDLVTARNAAVIRFGVAILGVGATVFKLWL
jgi:hypothetical protein